MPAERVLPKTDPTLFPMEEQRIFLMELILTFLFEIKIVSLSRIVNRPFVGFPFHVVQIEIYLYSLITISFPFSFWRYSFKSFCPLEVKKNEQNTINDIIEEFNLKRIT